MPARFEANAELQKLAENLVLSQDLRSAITQRIWGYALGMMGISIPLAAITDSPVIPILVIVGTTASTIAVWANPANKGSGTGLSAPQLKQLEERLSNLETIVSYEEPMLRTKIENLRSLKD